MKPILYYVDDDPEDLDIFSLAAATLNVDLHLFSEPVKMLAKIDASPVKPDIIFIDFKMTMISGSDVIIILRANNFKMPIIVLSTSSDEDDIKTAYNLGANDCITKPRRLINLTAAIRHTLNWNWSIRPTSTKVPRKF